jgi:Protein of unknown function (DUF1579)
MSNRDCILAAIAAVAALTGPSALAAQGGRQLARPAAQSTDPGAPAAEERLVAPARSVLRSLVGTWRFEIRFAGNFDGPPDVSGTRVTKALFDSVKPEQLEWTEQLDDSTLQGRGLLGIDPTTGRFFATAVYNAGAAPEMLSGTLDEAEPVVTFRPLGPGATPFTLSLVGADHLLVTALDHTWRAVFTRRR